MRKTWFPFLLFAMALQAINVFPAPVGYFSFDETEGAIFDSVTGTKINLQGSVKVIPGGVLGNCLSIARKDDGYVSLGTAYGFTGNFSISLWVKTAPRYAVTESIILDRHSTDGSWNGYFLFLNTAWGMGSPNKAAFYYTNGVVVSKSDINDGNWHQVGVVYHKGAGAELYFDGTLEASGPPPPAPMDIRANVGFTLGAMIWDKPHGNFEGDLDELMLFNQSLNPTDMAAIAANPKYRNKPDAVPSDAPIGPQLRIQLKNGLIMSIPTSEILQIDFGN